MRGTFFKCSSLEKAPELPNTVTNMEKTFFGCTNLTGTLEFRVVPEKYSGIFDDCAIDTEDGLTVYYTSENEAILDEILETTTGKIQKGKEIPLLSDWTYTTEENGTVVLHHYNGEAEKIYVPAYYKESKVVLTPEKKGKDTIGVFEKTSVVEVEFDGRIENADMTEMFAGCTSLTKAPVIPEKVTSLKKTFYGCKSLTRAPKLPGKVMNLEGTFAGCEKLKKAPVLPKRVKVLSETFKGCTSLTLAPVIPAGVTKMDETFYGCKNLTTVAAVPSSVTDLTAAFYGCKNMTGSISIYSTPKKYEKVFDKAAVNRKAGLKINYTARNKKTIEKIIKKSTGKVKKGRKVISLRWY